MYLTNVRKIVGVNIFLDVHLMYITMLYITNVQYVAYNAMLTKHIEMQIKTPRTKKV
jgi:hypothetical protein